MKFEILSMESVTFYIECDDGSLRSNVHGIPHFEKPFILAAKTLSHTYDRVYFLVEETT